MEEGSIVHDLKGYHVRDDKGDHMLLGQGVLWEFPSVEILHLIVICL